MPAPPAVVVSAPSRDFDALPPRVAALRQKILDSVATGDIEKLRNALEWSETPPSLVRDGPRPRGFGEIVDFLKNRSFDGKGRETLEITRAVFEAPYVVVKRGPFATYVWPSFAKVPLTSLSEDERLQMWRCIRFADLGLSTPDGRPLMQHATIGPDGTWHTFWAIH